MCSQQPIEIRGKWSLKQNRIIFNNLTRKFLISTMIKAKAEKCVILTLLFPTACYSSLDTLQKEE